MVQASISSALLLGLVLAFGACAQNQPANTTSAPAASQGTAAENPGSGTMPGQGMMAGRQGAMGPAMMDAGPGMMAMKDSCPMLVPGTAVQAQDMTNGMGMAFTTTGEVAELRRRVRLMAEHLNAQPSGSSGGMGMQGMMRADGGTAPMGRGMAGGMMPAVRAEVEDIDKGARLKTTPVDPSKLNDMREHMKQQVRMMNQSRGCSMMGDVPR